MQDNFSHVLLVEDDPEEIILVKKALRKSNSRFRMDSVSDGQECMDYLSKTGRYSNASKPDLILLDLNMPRKDGREVLKELQQDPTLKKIPVIVLTTSLSPSDIEISYETGANCFISKPIEFSKFQMVINEVVNFWLGTAQLPNGEY